MSFFKGTATRSGGKINLGLTGLPYYRILFPFLNVWKSGGPIEVIKEGVSYWSNIPPGFNDSAWGVFLDSNGELVSPLPVNTTQIRRTFYSCPQDGLPDGYSRVGERWVLKWDGTASGVTVAPASSQIQVGNKIEWRWVTDEGKHRIVFTGIDANDPPRDIRLCEARHEALLDAGELFNPDWLERVQDGSGIVRFMDWQSTNGNVSTLGFSNIPDETYYSYGSDSETPLIRGGVPVPVMSALANKVQSHPWVCIPHTFGTKMLTAITEVTNTGRAIVTSPGHNWQNGEKVLIYRVLGMTQLNQNIYIVENSDPKTGTLELSGVDTKTFGAYKSSGFLASPCDLDDIAREVGLLAAHFRDHMNPTLVTYFELSNETWNTIFDQSYWFSALGRQLYGRDGFGNQMSGYIAAHCMKVIRDTYGVVNRDKWKGVLATQTVSTDVTNRRIAGINHYIRRHCPSLKVTDLFDCLAVTGYFGGLFTDEHKSVVFDWMDRSEKLWRTGQEPTKYSFFNRVVNEGIATAQRINTAYSVDKLPVYWRAQKTIADANGLELVQYEGGNHNNAQFSPPLNAEEHARFMEFYKQCNHTPEDAANYSAMFSRFVEAGGNYPSKFVEAAPITYFGAWGGLRYLGDSNPVWDAVVRFNQHA